jgi:hypothetical protein
MTEQKIMRLREENEYLKESLKSSEEYAEQLRERDSLSFQVSEAARRASRKYGGYCWFILLCTIGILIWWEAMQIHEIDLQILEELQNNRSVRSTSDAKVILRRAYE